MRVLRIFIVSLAAAVAASANAQTGVLKEIEISSSNTVSTGGTNPGTVVLVASPTDGGGYATAAVSIGSLESSTASGYETVKYKFFWVTPTAGSYPTTLYAQLFANGTDTASVSTLILQEGGYFTVESTTADPQLQSSSPTPTPALPNVTEAILPSYIRDPDSVSAITNHVNAGNGVITYSVPDWTLISTANGLYTYESTSPVVWTSPYPEAAILGASGHFAAGSATSEAAFGYSIVWLTS